MNMQVCKYAEYKGSHMEEMILVEEDGWMIRWGGGGGTIEMGEGQGGVAKCGGGMKEGAG
jgi:hypothetical protein